MAPAPDQGKYRFWVQLKNLDSDWLQLSNAGYLKGTVSRDFPAQTAYIIHLQITSLFMDKKDFASFCKLTEIFALLSHSELSGTALSETGHCPGQL